MPTIVRMRLSVPPPGANGTTTSIVRVGYLAWASATGGARQNGEGDDAEHGDANRRDREPAHSRASLAGRLARRARGSMVHSGRMNRLLAMLLVLTLAAPAAAQPFTPDTVDMAAAKKEGTVTWYTSTPVETAQKIANLFEQETGIKVELFRSGGSAILRRFHAGDRRRRGDRRRADASRSPPRPAR